jgi:hypothetical protein
MMTTQHDKRLFPRRPTTPVPVILTDPTAAAGELAGQVLDYSPAGFTLQVEQALPVGRLVAVRPSRAADKPRIEATVVSCSAHDDGWRLGCHFVHTHHFDELRMFGD